MMNFIASWKTTIAGVALLAIAGLRMAGVTLPGFEGGDPGALIMGGIGLIFAKDANVAGVK